MNQGVIYYMKIIWNFHGVEVNGDRNFTEENLKAILYNSKDKSQESNKIQNITEIIVDQRLQRKTSFLLFLEDTL